MAQRDEESGARRVSAEMSEAKLPAADIMIPFWVPVFEVEAGGSG